MYNEVSNLPLILNLLYQTFLSHPTLTPSDVQVIVVEDNSPDGTREVAYELQESYGPEFVLVLERSGKLGESSGLLRAKKEATTGGEALANPEEYSISFFTLPFV